MTMNVPADNQHGESVPTMLFIVGDHKNRPYDIDAHH